jgi:signal transduction histidine kinase
MVGGRERIVHGRWNLERDREGKPASVLEVHTEVTERRHAEANLRLACDRLALAVDTAQLGGWHLDVATRQVTLSDTMQRHLGFARGEFRGTLEEIWPKLHLQDRPEVEKLLRDTIASGSPLVAQFRVILPSGLERRLMTHGRVVAGEKGEAAVRILGSTLDVTESRRLHDELRRSNEDLERFAYAASHDLKEPLRMVTSFLGLLDRNYRHRLDDTAQEYIGFAIDGATRMKSLIDDLLTYSRVGSDRAEERVDLNESLFLAQTNLATWAKEIGIVVDSVKLPVVVGNANELVQLFRNLLSNTVKYRNPGKHPTAKVTCDRHEHQWRISVIDEGMGFERADAVRIFEPFVRLHSRSEIPGTGMGLGICRKIVERRGGRIWADGSPGKGARFTFTLPIIPLHDAKS